VRVNGHDIELDDPQIAPMLARRGNDPLFRSGSVHVREHCLSFVYKAAGEIGELGDNVRRLRAAIGGDALLHHALTAEAATCVVLGHARWALVGMIDEANAHPSIRRRMARRSCRTSWRPSTATSTFGTEWPGCAVPVARCWVLSVFGERPAASLTVAAACWQPLWQPRR
jgi:hypothetical protein